MNVMNVNVTKSEEFPLSESKEAKEQYWKDVIAGELAANGPNKQANKDFVGRVLQPGDYVIFHQRLFEHFAYGVVMEEEAWPFHGSVMVRKLKPSKKGKFKDQFPIKANMLIKISHEELLLKTLESDLKRGYAF